LHAQAEAQNELSLLDARIPRLELRLTSPAPPSTHVEVDGREIPIGSPVELDPGEHIVRASAPEGLAERRIELHEGQNVQVVELALNARAVAPAPRGPAWPGGVALGAGVVGVLVGTVTGVEALALAGRVKDGCDGSQCLAVDKDKADQAAAFARASTISFIAGGTLVVLGAILLVLRPGHASVSTGIAKGLSLRF
jgi:hypothetical protein